MNLIESFGSTNVCPILLYHVAILGGTDTVLKMALNHKFGIVLSIWANISETVHYMTNVCMKHISEVIVYLMTFNS